MKRLTDEELKAFEAAIANASDTLDLEDIVALVPRLIREVKKHRSLLKDFSKFLLAGRWSGEDSWAQSDNAYEAHAEVGELFEKHIGFPQYNEKTDELEWKPK